MKKLNVGIFNDSFPPILDGVANTAVNYARTIHKLFGKAVVATPWYPKVKDDYPFDVVRYSSANIGKRVGYRFGNPFNPLLIKRIQKEKLDIMHTHSPFTSALLARIVRKYTGAPIVFTYHTKFDMDIDKRVALTPVKNVSVKIILSNINACDDVWVVSEGAGENLKSLGYKGSYYLMENGTDFERGRSSDEAIHTLEVQYNISPEDTVYLFVGRMMWYKNIRFIIDGIKAARDQGATFKMFFVGEGVDRTEIMNYSDELGLSDTCIFTGPIYDREDLRTYFSRANLFLFPSTYDTNGIVVREAAACSCPALLVKDSCAAEGIVSEDTGIIIPETVEAISQEIIRGTKEKERLKQIGIHAADKIYLSWDDAVGKAFERYHYVIDQQAQKKRKA